MNDEDGKLLDLIPICGCGTFDRNLRIVQAILERAEALSAAFPGQKVASFYDAMPEHGLSESAVELIVSLLSEGRQQLLEHGSGLGYSWLTPDGKLALSALRLRVRETP